MSTKKIYTTKKNLPGNIKSGTLVKYEKDGWFFCGGFGNKKPCMYEPKNEPDFFKVYVELKFKVGDEVYIKTKKTNITRNLSAKAPVEIISSTSTKRYTVEQGGKRFTVNESDMYLPEVYFFINSKGQIHKQVLSDEHRETYAYKYRVASKNKYKSRVSAEVVVKKLLEA